MSKLRRFMLLERARTTSEHTAVPRSTLDRFEAELSDPDPAPAGTPAASPHADTLPPGTRERFEAEGTDRPIGIAPRAADEQPFERCARCQADNERQRPQCRHCGNVLGTSAQRAYNAELWSRLQREKAAREAAAARGDHAEGPAPATWSLDGARHEMFDAFATVRSQQRIVEPPGIALLRQIPSRRARVGVVLGLIGFTVTLFVIAGPGFAPMAWTIAVVSLFTARGRRRRL